MTFAFILESVGGTEWFVLLGVVLIVVGPKNLPSAARKLGNIMSTLRRAADEFKRQLLSMDEEIRKQVDEAVSDDTTSSSSSGEGSQSASVEESDPSSIPDSEDRAEEEGSAYDYNSPYPGHEYYDETQYQSGTDEAGSEMGTGEASATSEAPAAEPAAPKADPYAVKITVSTSADKGKKKSK